MDKIFDDTALDDMMFWAHHNRKTLDKIYKLIRDIERNGASKGEGKPERLKHQPAWSRRIDKENRLVYDMENDSLRIISCKGHYED